MVSSPAPTSTSAPSAASAAPEPFSPISSSLYGSAASSCARLVVGDDAAGEGLALGDDRRHPLLEPLEVLRGERGLDAEVVVEAVRDRRPDAEPRVGEQLLHRLGEHVRARVPQHREALGRVDRHRLDRVAVLGHPGQVVQVFLVRPHDDGVDPGVGEDLGRRLAGRNDAGRTIDSQADVRHASQAIEPDNPVARRGCRMARRPAGRPGVRSDRSTGVPSRKAIAAGTEAFGLGEVSVTSRCTTRQVVHLRVAELERGLPAGRAALEAHADTVMPVVGRRPRRRSPPRRAAPPRLLLLAEPGRLGDKSSPYSRMPCRRGQCITRMAAIAVARLSVGWTDGETGNEAESVGDTGLEPVTSRV